jgi:hypothetical protein
VDVLVTDAHHCPGSLMIAMRFPTAVATAAAGAFVWTGDFRLMPEPHAAWAQRIGPVAWLGIDHSRRRLAQLPTLDEEAAELRAFVTSQSRRPVYVASRYHGIEEMVARTGLTVQVALDFPDAVWTRRWGGFRPPTHNAPDLILTRFYPPNSTAVYPSTQWHLCRNPQRQMRRTGRDNRTYRWRTFHSAHASGDEIEQLVAWLRPRAWLACTDPITAKCDRTNNKIDRL